MGAYVEQRLINGQRELEKCELKYETEALREPSNERVSRLKLEGILYKGIRK